ncbi:MAG: hypothetical protein Q8R90_04355 [Bacteroidales bacterium]|nr:hypothetical protein [Bacteroidales bacterium]
MKKLLVILFVALTTTLFAQEEIARLTYADSQYSKIYQTIKNNTKILKYISANGSELKIGDTLILGVPSGTTTSTTVVGGSEKSVGVARANSKSNSIFSTILMGKQIGFGTYISNLSDDSNVTAKANMQGEIVVIADMRVYHKGSRNKPLALAVLLGEPNGRAFGLYKYMSINDFEKSVLKGEILTKNAPLNREQAIAKLKEAKDLVDLGLMDADEYEKLKTELTPIIMKK